jgi:hypothetical protein
LAVAVRSGSPRLVALTGLAYVILVFVGSAVVGGTSGAGRHSLDATNEEVSEYVAGADVTRVWIGEFMAVVGYALFVLFAAHVWSIVRREVARDWRETSALGSAFVYVALALMGTACLAAVLNRTGDPVDAARFLDVRTVLFTIAFLFFATWLIATGLAALRSRALPTWLAGAAVAVGALQFAGTPFATFDPAFTGLPTFAGFVWVAIVSVLLVRRDLSAPSA